jgi:hypothetical protein
VSPLRRLAIAGAGVIAVGAVVAAGSKLVWATATPRGSAVSVPGFPKVVLAGGRLTMDAAVVGAGSLFGLGLLLALVPLGWLVVGPKGRTFLAVAALGICGVVFWQVAHTRSELVHRAAPVASRELRTASFRVASGSGIPVTAAGAAVAAVAAVVGATVGGGAPRIGLPDRPDRGERP